MPEPQSVRLTGRLDGGKQDIKRLAPMCHVNRLRLIRVLVCVMVVGGCGTAGQSVRSSPPENGRIIDMWNTYTHCARSDDLDAVRLDARRLNLAAGRTHSATDPTPLPFDRPADRQPSVRTSVDPAAMAAACALHAGQIAQKKGHADVAEEIFLLVITNFPQPSYRYYVAQAQRGLDLLAVPIPSTISSPLM